MTLLSRVEALTGPDRAVDAELAKMRGVSHMAQEFPPPYTASVDYALAFAEKALPPGFLWSVCKPPEGKKKRKRKSDDVHVPFDGYVATDDKIGTKSHKFALVEHVSPALAIVLAVLAVLRAKEGT